MKLKKKGCQGGGSNFVPIEEVADPDAEEDIYKRAQEGLDEAEKVQKRLGSEEREGRPNKIQVTEYKKVPKPLAENNNQNNPPIKNTSTTKKGSAVAILNARMRAGDVKNELQNKKRKFENAKRVRR